MVGDAAASRQTLKLVSGQLLPDLRIVPRAQVQVHEETDPDRVQRLIARLRADGVLRNPPVAAPLPDSGFVILDGANRVSALMTLGAPVVLLQVVDYSDPAVQLDVWNHLLVQSTDLPGLLRTRGLTVHEVDPDRAARRLGERAIVCYVRTTHGTVEVPAAPHQGPAAPLAAVVDAYKTSNRIYRVMSTDLDTLRREYGEDAVLVVFPTFTKREILEIARAPIKLPAGITRHLIPGRALRLNVPLDVLTSSGDVEQQNRWLVDEIHRRLLEHRIRYYAESSFLFDE